MSEAPMGDFSICFNQRRKAVVRRAVACAIAALLCLSCMGLSGCGATTLASRLGGLIGNGPSSFASTFTAAARGPRPEVTPVARDHFVDTSSAQSATVLVYMVGSDLESEEGAATNDLAEICQASLGSHVRVIVQTGGCSAWQNNVIADGNARYEIVNGQITPISDLGKFDSLTVNALADFIKWGASYAPADRTELILWDHGGGTFDGYGYDEYYEESTLTVSEIGQALEKAQVHLDFLGFDACLMGTVETAYSVRNWADYLIASEESEPETGWYYTNWLSTLGAQPSIDTVALGRVAADDMAATGNARIQDASECTLSVVDLAKVDWLFDVMNDYFDKAKDTLSSDFTTVSAARANAKEFGEDDYDQIDMVDYLDRFATEDTGRVAAAVENVVAYSATSTDIEGANGLAMYYPYHYVAYYDEIESDLGKIGFTGKVKQYFDEFTSIKGTGSDATSSGDMLSGLFGMVTGSVGSTLADSADRDGVLTLTDKGSYYALHLSDAQWETVVYAELWAYVDDGKGYLDLGAENTYEFDDSGDLKVDFDNKWIALNGQTVAYYTEGKNGDGANWYEYGYVPAVLNGRTDIDIMIYFDASHTSGEVVGYRLTNDGKPQVQSKGYKQFKSGDAIELVCDYYDYNSNYKGERSLGSITYTGQLSVSLQSLGNKNIEICYMLQDVYGDEYYTEYVDLY